MSSNNKFEFYENALKSPDEGKTCSQRLKSYLRIKKKSESYACFFTCCTVFSLLLGVIGPLILCALLDLGIYESVVIDSTSAASYDVWQTNAFGEGTKNQVTYDVYYFNVQNPEEIVSGGKPAVVEQGPYAFNEYFYKFDVSWMDDGDTVQFTTWTYYVFDASRTGAGLSLEDKILVPYATVLGFNYLLAAVPQNVSAAIEVALLNKTDTLILSLESGLNAAYQSNGCAQSPKKPECTVISNALADAAVLQKGLDDFISASSPTNVMLKMLMCRANAKNPDISVSPFWYTNPAPGYFGWLNDVILMEVKNLLLEKDPAAAALWNTAVPGASVNYSSVEDTKRRISPDVMKTGKKNVKKVSSFVRSNNMTTQFVCVVPLSENTTAYDHTTEFPACPLFQHSWTTEQAEANGYRLAFNTPYANRIAGTDATLFGRPVTTDKLQVYINDIYRTVYVEYSEDVYDWHNIRLRRYMLQQKDLLNASMDPSAAQYFNFAPSGMENLTGATGIPVWASQPHFYQGASDLIAAVEGMRPTKETHETTLDIEPETGVLARANKRLQLNYYLSDWFMPNISSDAVTSFNDLCQTVQSVNESKTPYDCAAESAFFQCLAVESNWRYRSGGVYFPYTWTQEAITLSNSDADDIKNSVYFLNDMAVQLRVWSMVAAGIFFSLLVGLAGGAYLIKGEISKHNQGSGLSFDNEDDERGEGRDIMSDYLDSDGIFSSDDSRGNGGHHSYHNKKNALKSALLADPSVLEP